MSENRTAEIFSVKPRAVWKWHSADFADRREEIDAGQDGALIALPGENLPLPSRDERKSDAAFVEAPLLPAEPSATLVVERRVRPIIAAEYHQRRFLQPQR